jgi:hypothetical protein
MQIELKPLLDRNGDKVRGSRAVWVAGEHWCDAREVGHGSHGPSLELFYPDGEAIADAYDGLRTKPLTLSNRHDKWNGKGGQSALQQLPGFLSIAIGEGKIKSPLARKAEEDLAEAQWQEKKHAREEKRGVMREGLLSVLSRSDLSLTERAGLSLAYREIFPDALLDGANGSNGHAS